MNEESLKAKLKVIAQERGMTFNQVWKQLLLERFLARLANSDHQEKFIFKGGLLLANYINIGRETQDIDFLLRKLNAEEGNIENVMKNIISHDMDDNMHFDFDKIEILAQPHMEYSGFRVFLHAKFGKMKDKIQIDIGVGDAVDPIEKIYFPFEYKGKPIFAGEISLLVYPPETIYAEKLESIISRGALNSRMKDYHDILLLSRENGLLNFKQLKESINSTFSQRGTKLIFPLVLDATATQRLQQLWANHLRGLGDHKNKLNLPNMLDQLVLEVTFFLFSNNIITE